MRSSEFHSHCKFQTGPIAGGEKFPLPLPSASPDGSRSVDHISAGQVVGACYLRFPGLASAKSSALFQQIGPRSPVDRPVHTAASEKCRICGIYNGIHVIDFRDIAPNGTDDRRFFLFLFAAFNSVYFSLLPKA